MTKDRRLGRGLAALLGTPLEQELAAAPGDPDASPPRPHGEAHADGSAATGDDGGPERLAADPQASVLIPVELIEGNPFQPRRDFSEPEIGSLAESLKEHDMLQPVLVRRDGPRYQLISGERRFRAAVRAGWTEIPARIRVADDRLVAELAIVENLQRRDLNAVEKALSFKRYIEQHQCTQEDLARRLKIDRSTIANFMRLLELPEPVLDALRRGDVSAGHARALLPLGDESQQIAFSARIQREGLSVREVERLVNEIVDRDDSPLAGMPRPGRPRRSEQVTALEQELRNALGTRVEISASSRGRGRIVVHFANHDEFDRLRDLLAGGDTQPEARAA